MTTGFIVGLCILVIIEYFSLKKMKEKNALRIAELQKATAKHEAEAAHYKLRAAELDARIRPTLQKQ